MKMSALLATLCHKGMLESMGVDLMVALARIVINNYDINKRSGIPESIPITKKDASTQIMMDIKSEGVLFEFANLLVKIHLEGYMGRPCQITTVRQIIREMFDLGYMYDQEYKMFIENSEVHRTPNWGVLKEGAEHSFTFLRLDIAGNSILVRDNSAQAVEAAYAELRKTVEKAVEKRNGRIWSWEGDGVLAAFYFSRKEENATLSAIEITHELYIYNATRCGLKSPLNVRIAINTGLCNYTSDIEKIKKSDTIKKTIEMEAKHTPLNTVTITGISGQHFSDNLVMRLSKTMAAGSVKYFNYSLKWIQQ